MIAIVNTCLILVISLVFGHVYLLHREALQLINKIKNNTKVIEKRNHDMMVDQTHRTLYKEQTYNFKLEDYLLDDIYKDLSDDIRPDKVQQDYFKVFSTAIDTILNNKKKFTDSFLLLSNPTSLQYDFYIPVVKFGKYATDYETYLAEVNSNHLFVNTELTYPNFKTDPRFFLDFTEGKCKRHIHILKILEIAVNLYIQHKQDVNECLYHGKCNKPQPVSIVKDVCSV